MESIGLFTPPDQRMSISPSTFWRRPEEKKLDATAMVLGLTFIDEPRRMRVPAPGACRQLVSDALSLWIGCPMKRGRACPYHRNPAGEIGLLCSLRRPASLPMIP